MNSPLSSGLTIPTNPAPTPQPVSSAPTQIYSNNDSFSPLESSLESYFSQKLYEQDSHFMASRPSTDAIPSQDYARRAMRASGLIAYVTSDLSPHRAKQAEATFGRTSPYRQDKYSGMLVGRALCANFGYAGDPVTFIRNHGKTALNLELPQTGYHSANELYSLIGTTFATQQRNDFTKALQAEQARAKALEETRQRLLPGALTRAVTGNSITPDEDAALKACGITDDSLAKVRLLTGLSGLATVDPASGIQHNAANSLNGLSLLGLEHNASLKGFSLFDRNGLLKASKIIGSDEKARALYLNLMRIAGRNHRNSHYSPHFLSNFAQSTAELFLSTTRAFADTAIDLGMNAAVGSASLFQEDGYASRYKALVHDATSAFQEGYEQREKELNLKHSDSALSRVAWNLQDFPTLIKEPIADTAPYLNLYTAIGAIGGKAVEEQNRAAANAKGDPNAGLWELGVIPTARAAIFGASVYGTGWASGKLLGSLSNTSIGRSVAARVAISPKTSYAANVTEGIITEAVEEAVDAIGQESLEASGLVAERQKRQNWKQFTELMQDSQFWGADIGMNLVFGAFGYKGSRSKSPYKDVLKQLGFSDKEQKSLQLDLVKAHMAGASQASIADLVREAVAKKEADNPELFKQRATSMVANAQQKEAIRAAAANGIRNHVLKQAHVSDMKLNDDNTYTVQRIAHAQDGKFELVEERFTEDQLNDWLASDVSRSVTAEILYLQSLVRGEQVSRAAESAETTPFSRVVSLLNAPAELLSKLDGKTSFDADTLTLFSEYALEQINLRLASGQSQAEAEAAEFGTTGSTLGAVSRLASDFDSRVSHAIATGELQPGDIPQSNAYILPGATPGDNILMLARGEASAKDVAHDWLEGFARSRYLANPAYWQQALSALDADLLNSGISSQSLFSHSPSERSHLEYIEAFSHLAELSFLANHAALPLSDHSHGLLDEVLDDLGAVQGGLELASQLQQYLTSDAAKNAVGEALDPLRGILTDAGAALTDLLATAEASSPKSAADFIIHNQQNMDEDVRIRLADLAQSADAPPITNSAPINPTEIGVPEQATGGTPITVADLAKLNGLNADGTRPAPIGATYSRIDPKKNGLSLIGGLAHGLPDGSISGSAKLANISLHPTIGSIDPARLRPNADEKEVILFRKKDGSLQAIGGLAFLHHATTCGVENVPVRVYSSGKKYTPQWAAKTAAESAIRANLASTAQTLSYLSKYALTRDKARRSNLIPKDANGQELPSSRAAWLLLQHASKKTIADTISGRLSTAQALATIEDKAASLLKQAAQFSLPGFETSSFSVIGKNARTWDKYASRAFLGRDDNLMRAEIDSSKAKFNQSSLLSEAENNLETLNDFFPTLTSEQKQLFRQLEETVDTIVDLLNTPGSSTEELFAAEKRKTQLIAETSDLITAFLKTKGITLNSPLNHTDILYIYNLYYNGMETERPASLLSKFGNTDTPKLVALHKVLDFPELYEAYPQLKHYTVELNDNMGKNVAGSFSTKTHNISIPSSLIFAYNINAVLLHEIQHAIQEIEGFAPGGNKNTAREHAFLLATIYPETYSFLDDLSDHELYLRLAGEIEARNVEKRRYMDESTRSSIPFNSTLEYPGEAIVPSSFSVTSKQAQSAFNKDGILEADNAIITKPGASFSVKALHASPHNFRKFSTEKMGSGEGAQAYGWGLYFAESEEVNEFYFNNFYNRKTVTCYIDDEVVTKQEMIDCITRFSFMALGDTKECKKLANSIISRAMYLGSFADALRFIRNNIDDYSDDSSEAREILEALDMLEDGGFEIKAEASVSNYRVELNVDDSNLLMWDERYSGQKIKDLLGDVLFEQIYDEGDEEASLLDNGEGIYMLMKSVFGGKEAASKKLLESGVKGIKYLDGNSRSAGEGSYNYVIFDGNDIKITAINESGVWNMTEGWEEYTDTTASFSISPARARRKYMPLSEAVKLEQYLAMEAYARRLYRDAQALAQANPKNKLDDAVRAAMHLRALLNAVFSTLPKEAQPWKALGHARKQIDSLTWAVSHSYADLDPHQAPGITPAEIEKYNQSGYRDRRQWLTNKLSRLIISVADSAARSIEAHACRTLLATAETTINTLLPKYQKSGKERRGTTAADVFNKAVDFYKMFDWSTEKRSEELVSVSNTLNTPDITDAERIQAEKRRQAILAFAGLTRESLPRVKAGVELLLAYIQTGRLAWEQKLLEERRATEAIQEAIAALEPKIEHSATTAKESKKQGGFANLFTSFQNPVQTLNQLANLPGKVGAIYANIRTRLAMAEDNKTYAIQQAHQDAAAALDAILGCTTDPSISRQIKRATFLSEANESINTGITKPGRIKITTFQFSQQDISHLLTIRQEQGEDAFRAELDKHRRKYATEDQLDNTIPYEEVFNDALSQLQSPEYRGGTIYVEHYGERDTAHEDTLTLTRLQAANLWLLAQQPSYANKYDQEGNLIERGMLDTLGYTDAIIDQLEQFCGKQLIAYAIWKREYLNTTGLFEAYEEHMGLPFPKEENYWPGAFDTASNNAGTDALQTAYQGNGVYNMLIIRKKHLSEPNLTIDIEAAWEHAISQHYHYIHLSPITRQLRAITRDPDTRQRLRKIVGNATLDNLEVQVNSLDGAPAQQLQAAAHANNLLSRFLSAWAKALLNMATGTTVKQVSAAAHALAHQGINLFNIAPKLLTATLTDITGHPLKPGHVTPRDIRQLTAFRVRFNREDLSTMASRLAPGETQGKLALIDLLGSRFLEYTDAWANSQAMAAVYNTEYDRAKTIMLTANNGAPLTPEQEQQLTQHCIETVAVTLKQTAQPLEREDKAAIAQQRNWAMNQNFFMMGEIISKIGCTVSLIKADYAKAYNLPPAQAAKLRRKAWLKGLTFYSGMGIASQALLAALSYAIGSAPDSDDEEFINWVLNNLAAGALGFSYINAIPIIGETFSSLVQSIPGTGGKFGVFATYATTGVGITYKDLQDLAKAINPDKTPEERLYAGSNSLRVLTTLTGFFAGGVKGANTFYETLSAANNLNNLIRPALQHAKNSSKKESKKAKQELQSLKRQLRQIRSTKKVTPTS